jgi:TetR/AcrR family transcriptional regulator, cholesterol catabolism regulator
MVAEPRRSERPGPRTARPRASSRGKRDEIVVSAVEHFGREGYEDTKWADVAAAVKIGPTALYHYFESKLHCLYVIMADALEFYLRDFERIMAEQDGYLEALVAALRGGYDLSEHEVLRMRVLAAEQGLVGIRRKSPREEEARELARGLTRDLEFAWATFLVRGMQQGLLPEADPRLLARTVLGLNVSVWHWYRPRGTLSLQDLSDFFVRRQLAAIGLSPELADGTDGGIAQRAGLPAAG